MARVVALPSGFEEIDFKKHHRGSRTAQGRMRCLAMMHLQKGKTVEEAAQAVGQSRQSVHLWLRWLVQSGVERLTGKVKGRGRKSLLHGVDSKQIQQSVLQLQKDRQGGSVTGREIQKYLKSRWGRCYSRSGVYEALKRLGLSWVSGRSIHPDADLQAQEEFKKTSGKKSKKPSPGPSRSKTSKSGSKTNTELANKGR